MRSDNRSGNAWVYSHRGDKWRVYFRVAGRLSGSRAFATEAEAEAEADRIRAEITVRSRSVGSAVDAYLDDLRLRSRREGSIKNADRALRTLLAGTLDSPLSALTPRRCEALYAALVSSGYAVRTQHLYLKLSRAFGAWCAHSRRRWVKVNPFASVEKIGDAPDLRSQSLRIDEARAFRAKAFELADGGDAGALGALIALTCSLRPSEIVQIEARDVDDGAAVPWVDGATLKTKNTRRPVEVADAELRGLLVRATDGKAPTDRLVPFNPKVVSAAAARVVVAANLPTANARMLRRTFATLAARRGRSLDDLAFSMGHGADANASTARTHYIAPGAREAGAAGRVLGVLDGGNNKTRGRRAGQGGAVVG